MTGRSQHTIPQFYLRPFLSPGFVYRRGQAAPRATKNPKRVAAHQDYYGKASELDEINKRVEDLGAPALRKLVSKNLDITADDWEDLSFFLANLALRIPAYINELRDVHLSAIDQMNEILGPQIAALPPEPDLDSTQLDKINDFGDRLRSTGGYREAIPIVAFADVARCIRQMEFVLVDAPEGSQFITSDRPLTLRTFPNGSRVGAGWSNRDALGQIALCPSRLLIMVYRNARTIRLVQATPEQVEWWNEEIIICADRELYSPSENLEALAWMSS